jgi:hypothetical protein
VPNLRDKVLLSHEGITEIGEIRAIRVIRNGEKRYLIVFRDCRGNEVGVWRKLSNLKDLNSNPLME